MGDRIKQMITRNIGLKALAVFFACLLWLFVINVDDPTQSRNFTTPVTVINDVILEEQGKYYEISEEQNTVTFRVTARRSVIEKLSSSDFSATADMNYLEDGNRIPIDISATRYANSLSISSKTHYLYVEIGDELDTNFVIRGQYEGVPAAGFAVNSVSVVPNVINIEGPETIVSKINSVIATCDVTGMNSDVTESVVPVLYDENGKEVPKTDLNVNLETVDVSVDMVCLKEVPLEVKTSGSLPNGYELRSITTTPKTLVIKGEAEFVNDITSIEIPPTVISLPSITSDVDTNVDVTSYLPEGVSLNKPEDANVNIQVKVAKEESRNYSVPTANLTVQNLSEGKTVRFEDETIQVSLTGVASALAGINESTLTGSVDVSGLEDGEHTVAVTISTGNSGVTAEQATCHVTILSE